MKNRVIIVTLMFFITVCGFCEVCAQCTNRVTHLSGTTTINGINITVSSSGSVSSYFFCGAGPYWSGGPSNDGSYTFSFSPSVGGVTIDFAGINSATTGGIEEIRIDINGSHYPIPSVGKMQTCEKLAMLTSNGDITGISPNDIYGWDSTTIIGSISSITVLNKAISGLPYGTSFGLSFCNSLTNVENVKTNFYVEAHPNPSNGKFTVDFIGDLTLSEEFDWSIEIYNVVGEKIYWTPKGDKRVTKEVDLFDHPKGIYFAKIDCGEKIYLKKIVLQ